MAKLGQVFNKPVETQKLPEKWKVEYIHFSKLKRSKFQYCDAKEEEEIENLADLILASGGVEQNLLVRKTNADEYEIIAGHKRSLACERLVERGFKEYAFLPCMIRTQSEAKTRLSVITSNAHHTKTQYEIMHEIQELKYLMENYPEEFPNEDMRGRIIERIAKQMGISRSTTTDYVMIGNGLSEKGMESFKKGEIKKDAALALSTLPEEEQDDLLEQGVTKGAEIKAYKKERNEPKIQEEQKEEPNFGTDEVPGQLEIVDTQMHIEEVVQEKQVEEDPTGIKKLIENYKTWKICAKNPLAEETFYRYNLPGGNAVVVKHYIYGAEGEEGEATEYYFLEKGYRHFHNCIITKAELVERIRKI